MLLFFLRKTCHREIIMRILLLANFLFLASFELLANTTLKVQTFNAYGPIYARHLESRTKGLLEAIEKDPSDIYLFQEVWEKDHQETLANKLSKGHPFSGAFGMNKEFSRDGLFAFGKGKVLSHKVFNYPLNQDGLLDKVRGFFGVVKAVSLTRVKLEGIGNVLLVNTHTHPLSSKIRVAQMVFLAKKVLEHKEPKDALIVAGDFNFTPFSLPYRLLVAVLGLEDAFLQVQGAYGAHCTYCEGNTYGWGGPSRVIDYIFYQKTSGLKLLSAQINLKRGPKGPLSDHFGVTATLKLDEKREHSHSLAQARKVIFEAKEALEAFGEQKGESAALLAALDTVKGWLSSYHP